MMVVMTMVDAKLHLYATYLFTWMLSTLEKLTGNFHGDFVFLISDEWSS